jgi:hypothetical protein
MHLGCLLGKPVLALFGPTDPNEVGPWTRESVALKSSGCTGCFELECALENMSCMDDISTQSVIRIVSRMLRGESRLPVNNGLVYMQGSDVMMSGSKTNYPMQAAIIEAGDRNRKANGGQKEPLNAYQEEVKELLEECERFYTLINLTLSHMKAASGPRCEAVKSVNKSLYAPRSPLRTLVVMNDFKHLDKRKGVGESLEAYEVFYRGILEDIETLVWQIGGARHCFDGHV